MSTSKTSALYCHELPGNLEYVNCDPIHLAEHNGRPFLLHFFALSAIHSTQHLQDIRAIQTRFKDQLLIIGAHTPKHRFEADSVTLKNALRRYAISYPVINDEQWQLWRQFAIEAWPTSVLFDGGGKLVEVYVGEGLSKVIETRIQELVHESGSKPKVPVPVIAPMPLASKLSFPSKITHLGDRLYISDSAHHRVLECTFGGQITRTFGSGNPGFWDGAPHEAGLREPGGISIGKDQLFICDTGNHAIRRVRLLQGNEQIETIAGTGKRGTGAVDSGASRTIDLASPSDCVFHHDKLYVTLAGQHQLWAVDLLRNTAQRLAGSGQEGHHDGALMAVQFAAPSAIAHANIGGRELLYVLDAASSALRQVKMQDFSVSTLIGEAVYEHGDSDGPASLARLQYPTSLCFDTMRNVLWIADSYNNKIKVYSPAKNEIKTLNVNYKLNHPSGMTIADQALWITNEHAHELLRLDLKTGRLARIPVGE
jgi:hypothetical protein